MRFQSGDFLPMHKDGENPNSSDLSNSAHSRLSDYKHVLQNAKEAGLLVPELYGGFIVEGKVTNKRFLSKGLGEPEKLSDEAIPMYAELWDFVDGGEIWLPQNSTSLSLQFRGNPEINL